MFASIQKHPRYRLTESIDVLTAAAEIQQLPAENISLGGMFLKTTTPPPPGSPLRLRLRSAGAGAATIGLVGRVVYVIDVSESEKKAHPAGIGVEFDPLSPQTELLLRRFVDGLAAQVERDRALQAPVHFVSLGLVEVKASRSALQEIWRESLSVGGLFAEGDPPGLGCIVKVVIGPLSLAAEVVHVVARGAGLQLKDLDGNKREAVLRFLDGRDEELVYREVKSSGAPLGKVLAAARQLFQGIDSDDGFAAIGLPSTATEVQIKERVQLLTRLLSTTTTEATPPQLARLEAARRALVRLEPEVIHRAGALRREAELVPQKLKVDVGDIVRDLLAEAFHYEKAGKRELARSVLARALEVAPDDDRVQKRLLALDEAVNLIRAADLMSTAESFVQGIGMKEEAVVRARDAVRLCRRREIRLRAVRVFAKAGEHLDATLLAEELLEADPRDPLALQALLHLYERVERWSEAARIGERLVRLRAGDDELKARVKKIVERVRR